MSDFIVLQYFDFRSGDYECGQVKSSNDFPVDQQRDLMNSHVVTEIKADYKW